MVWESYNLYAKFIFPKFHSKNPDLSSESQGDLIWHGEEEIAAYTVTDENSSFPRDKMFDESTTSIWHSSNKLARVIINFKVRIEKKTMKNILVNHYFK